MRRRRFPLQNSTNKFSCQWYILITLGNPHQTTETRFGPWSPSVPKAKTCFCLRGAIQWEIMENIHEWLKPPPPSLTLAKQWQNHVLTILIKYQPYGTKCSLHPLNISPIYHQNQGHISVIWIWKKSENPVPLIRK